MPEKPSTRPGIVNGTRRSPRGPSVPNSAINSAELETMKAASPDGTHCSDQVTTPLPITTSPTPSTMSVIQSRRLGQRPPRANPARVRPVPAHRKRKPASTAGGMFSTPIRMKR